MANRRQRTARRLEEQEQDQEQGQEQATEPAAEKGPSLTSVPAGKPKSARKMFLVLWGIPLVLFIITAIVKG